MTVLVIIPTCDRLAMLKRLIRQLRAEAADAQLNLIIQVYDDFSEEAVDPSQHGLHGVNVRRNDYRYGKQEYHKTVHKAFRNAARCQWDYLLYLPDDVELIEGFFHEMFAAWYAITDRKKIALSLLSDERRGSTQWVPERPRLVRTIYGPLWLQRWLDMCFFAPRAFLDALHWKINPIPPAFWRDMPRRSSGVGRQISRRLHFMGYHVWSVDRSLVIHDGFAPSQMHPPPPGTTGKRPVTILEGSDVSF